MADIQAFFDPQTATVTYLAADPATKAAAIIDPVLDFEPKAARLTTGSIDAVLKVAAAKGLNIVWVLDTHAHADHLSAADYVRTKTGAKLGIGSRHSGDLCGGARRRENRRRATNATATSASQGELISCRGRRM